MIGTIAGIARHPRAKAPMEVIDHVEITIEAGLHGDWAAAMAEVGQDIPWYERRANLLVDGFDLPQIPGTRLRIGADVVLEVTRPSAIGTLRSSRTSTRLPRTSPISSSVLNGLVMVLRS